VRRSSTRRSVIHIEKKSFVNKKVAAATIIPINSRRVDLSKPEPVRVETYTRVKYMVIEM
jgi:hypothetical protein